MPSENEVAPDQVGEEAWALLMQSIVTIAGMDDDALPDIFIGKALYHLLAIEFDRICPASRNVLSVAAATLLLRNASPEDLQRILFGGEPKPQGAPYAR